MNTPHTKFNHLLEGGSLSFWRLQISGWLFYGVMIYVTFLTVAAEGTWLRLFYIKAFRTVIGFTLTSLLRLAYRSVPDTWTMRQVSGCVLGSSVIGAGLWMLIEFAALELIYDSFNFWKSVAGSQRVVLDYSITLIAWSALYFGLKSWLAWQSEHDRALQAQALAREAQLELLRYQLNPHFLFNALNSIRASIDEDKARSKRLVTEFSEFLRFSLLSGNHPTIRLEEEIEAIENYLAIEKIRFEEKLHVIIDIAPEAKGFQLPAFLIHPLVENAIKHSTMNRSAPLQLRISATVELDQLVIEVANTGRLRPPATTNGTGVGLNNIRARLAHHFSQRSRFELREDGDWIRAIIEISPVSERHHA